MKKRKGLPELGRTELDILKCFWKEGRLTARETHDRIGRQRPWAYSTTRTLIERMVRKGLLSRGRFHGLSLYEPAITKPMGLALRIQDFAEQVLESDSGTVVALLAPSGAWSPYEIEELTEILDSKRGRVTTLPPEPKGSGSP